MVALTDIREMAEQIAREFKPERIVLLGFYARGSPTPDSGIDLLGVVEHPGKTWE
jgi:predicted nucleotidyltransferase